MSLRDFASCFSSLGPILQVCACLPNDLRLIARSLAIFQSRSCAAHGIIVPMLDDVTSVASVTPRSITRLFTHRMTQTQRSCCASHRCMVQSHALCMFITVDHCKSASVNRYSLFSILDQQISPVQTSCHHGNVNVLATPAHNDEIFLH